MAGLVPAIHVVGSPKREDVDARHKAGHDELYRKRRASRTMRPGALQRVYFARIGEPFSPLSS